MMKWATRAPLFRRERAESAGNQAVNSNAFLFELVAHPPTMSPILGAMLAKNFNFNTQVLMFQSFST